MHGKHGISRSGGHFTVGGWIDWAGRQLVTLASGTALIVFLLSFLVDR